MTAPSSRHRFEPESLTQAIEKEVQSQTASTSDVLPVLDLGIFIHRDSSSQAERDDLCLQVASTLQSSGCLIVRDPRVDHAENDSFIDMMEVYFGRTGEDKKAEERPELSYQVGYTPEKQEVPRVVKDRNLQDVIEAQPEGHKATLPTQADVKCRYMWPLRERHSNLFKELNANQVTPKGIPGWESQMNSWGEKMLGTVETVAEMAAVGFGLPPDSFLSRMRGGPHILAPTGSDLSKHGQIGTCYAGFHYDLNFITIHGKSRFPGLFVWLRDGRRVAVAIPDGCLLLQAGQQLEWLTGGAVMAGMHEVVCTSATQAAIDKARSAGRCLWRVSSTVFSHVASDVELVPLGGFLSKASETKYPRTLAGIQVQQELQAIRLMAET